MNTKTGDGRNHQPQGGNTTRFLPPLPLPLWGRKECGRRRGRVPLTLEARHLQLVPLYDQQPTTNDQHTGT